MKRTKEEAQVTKERLIKTAFKEFLDTGFAESKLETIASKAGVTRGAFYWHFKDKSDLLESVIEYTDTESLNICKEIFESEISAFDKLETIISLNFPVFKTKKSEINYVRLKVELYNHFIKEGDKRNIAGNFTNWCFLLLNEMKENDLVRNNIDLTSAAFSILTMCSGSYIRYNSLPENIRSLDTLKSYVLNYLKLIMK
ncbi:MAG TPA: TetR family transcriptional regulator [Ignavibacteria bacterium]|nr:TetR family transcriptional regulator [Ignavibacteria bacterium]